MHAIVKSLDKLYATTYTLRNLANDAWEFSDRALSDWDILSDKDYFQAFISEDVAIEAWEAKLQSAHEAAIEADESLELLFNRLLKVNTRYAEVLTSLTP